jgi:hypothetical protein
LVLQSLSNIPVNFKLLLFCGRFSPIQKQKLGSQQPDPLGT